MVISDRRRSLWKYLIQHICCAQILHIEFLHVFVHVVFLYLPLEWHCYCLLQVNMPINELENKRQFRCTWLGSQLKEDTQCRVGLSHISHRYSCSLIDDRQTQMHYPRSRRAVLGSCIWVCLSVCNSITIDPIDLIFLRKNYCPRGSVFL